MKSPQLPQGEEKTRVVREMFDVIASRYEFVNRVMTFGLDAQWRRACVRNLYLPSGSKVLDLAAGTGDFTRELTKQGHLGVATDLSFGMLHAARSVPERVQADGAQLPYDAGTFDGLTCGYALRNFTELQKTFDEMARVLRPNGRLSILEISEPNSRILRLGFTLWFRKLVPLIGSLISNRAAYKYLPKSTAYLPDKDELIRMLNKAGFSGVNHRAVMGGVSQQLTATRIG
jgi:demethylmenaquinone methyltransferase / 2-methoxy-6-polyprenyl-1,4-benzoquinol methylase